jgi:AcrR family transcriptional regulator
MVRATLRWRSSTGRSLRRSPVPRTKQRTPELRQHVLSVALELLASDGVAAFTTRNVARQSETSPPAIYELFGDKSGLVREVFFQGFRMLRRHLGDVPQTDDPRADLLALMTLYRSFVRQNPVLCEVMFSRPFTDFAPSGSELNASGSVRTLILAHVRRCIQAGLLHGEETDIAHVLIALAQGLAAAENTRRLGSSRASVDRRWALAVEAMLHGLSS